uniref:DUF3778 domain-containing protein n=1 Tax=Oryza rufipogon TaxID=4529 RepID=A0A0E0PIJ2_ORYRU
MAAGMVRAAGIAMSVVLFTDPAMAPRPVVEGTCSAGGLYRQMLPLWRRLATVVQGGWPDRDPRSRSSASSVEVGGVESSRRAGGVNNAGTIRWYLGASAVDALVYRVSEVKTLFRSDASNGDALGRRSTS